MSFGKYIIASFVMFALFIAVLVFICIREDLSLVSKNYYQEELEHSMKMEQSVNTQSLVHPPDIFIHDGSVMVSFDEFGKVESGELRLMRPSNADLDRSFPLNSSSETIRQFQLDTVYKGLYRASMKWKMNGKEYFFEKVIVI